MRTGKRPAPAFGLRRRAGTAAVIAAIVLALVLIGRACGPDEAGLPDVTAPPPPGDRATARAAPVRDPRSASARELGGGTLAQAAGAISHALLVFDARTRTPVADATCRVGPETDAPEVAVSDVGGRIVISDPAAVVATIAAAGYRTRVIDLPRASASSRLVPVPMVGDGGIAGRIVDANWNPVAEALVSVPSHSDAVAVSGADGRYSLDGLVTGSPLEVHVRSRAHEPLVIRGVDPTGRTPVDAVLTGKAVVRVRVRMEPAPGPGRLESIALVRSADRLLYSGPVAIVGGSGTIDATAPPDGLGAEVTVGITLRGASEATGAGTIVGVDGTLQCDVIVAAGRTVRVRIRLPTGVVPPPTVTCRAGSATFQAALDSESLAYVPVPSAGDDRAWFLHPGFVSEPIHLRSGPPGGVLSAELIPVSSRVLVTGLKVCEETASRSLPDFHITD